MTIIIGLLVSLLAFPLVMGVGILTAGTFDFFSGTAAKETFKENLLDVWDDIIKPSRGEFGTTVVCLFFIGLCGMGAIALILLVFHFIGSIFI